MQRKTKGLLSAIVLSLSLGVSAAGQSTTVKGPNGQTTTIATSGGTTTVKSGGTTETNHEGHKANVKRVRDMYDRER